MFLRMETNRVSDFIVKSEGHCFLCLSKVFPKLAAVKVEPDAGRKSTLKIQAVPSVFLANHSLQPLSRYLKLNLGVVLKGDDEAFRKLLKVKLERSRLKVSLCEGCGVLNVRFSELFQQLEKIQMEVTHCLGAIRGKLTEAEQSTEERLGLGREELDILEALREETMEKCLYKLDQITPRVRLEKLRKQNFQKILAEQVTTSSLEKTKPALKTFTSTNAKREIDSQSEVSSQLDIELANMKREIPISEKEADKAGFSIISDDKLSEPVRDDFEALSPSPSEDNDTSTNFKAESTCLPEINHFGCKICGKHFNAKAKLAKHHQVVHLKLRPHGCDECGKHFSTKTLLESHREVIHLKLKRHRCFECGRQFGNPSNLRKHWRRKHPNLKPQQRDVGRRRKYMKRERKAISVSEIEAKDADYKTPPEHPTSDNEQRFEKNPDTGRFKCSDCDREFGHMSSVRTHYRTAHLKLKLFGCDICGKRFGQQGSLQTHHRSIHLKLKPFRCDECGKQFSTKGHFKLHLETSHPNRDKGNDCSRSSIKYPARPLKTDKCGKRLGQKNKLQSHQQIVHRKLKPHKCDHCERLFSTKQHLKNHHEAIHLKLVKPKQFQCDICGKQVRNQWTLNHHHKTIHLNMKEHQCNHCGKTFSTLRDLRTHVDGVHLETKHGCDQCGKQYTTKCHLHHHIKVVHSKS